VTRLKVLHLITSLPRLSGAADNTRYTANLLDPKRYEVHVAFGKSQGEPSGIAPHVRTIAVPSLVRELAPTLDMRTLATLIRQLHTERYDIVHTHNSKAGVIGRVAARLVRVPVIVHTAHTISFAASANGLVNRLYQFSDMACAPFTTRIVTVSRLNTERYLNAGIGKPEQYLTIYSGVEVQRYLDRSERESCRTELGLDPQSVLILWIGRLNRQKDPLTFVYAARQIATRLPQARFVIIGDDPLGESLEPKVREEVKRLGLEGVIKLLGYRPDVHRFLAAADLVLHTSLYEGLGRSVIETMLSGVPIVATSVDGVMEAVVSYERGGILVAPGDPGATAAAAMELISDPDLSKRLAAAGKTWAQSRFDVQAMVAAIDHLYQELWQHHHRRAT